jgi:di/tricarboxylate transporter
LFPVRKNIGPFLIISFLLGLSVDFFSDSGGIHAAASTFIAFARLPYLKFVLGKSDFDFLLFHLGGIPLSKAIVFLSGLTFVHHLIVFSLEYFSLSEFVVILSKTFYTSLFTIFLSILALLLFSKRK